MTRSRRDIDDFDNLFDRDEAAERKRRREEMIKVAAERSAMFAAQDAKAKERAREMMLRANDAFLLRDYAKAGVEPPQLNGRGAPAVSLPTLRSLGWEVRDVDGRNVLVAPPPPEPARKRDYR